MDEKFYTPYSRAEILEAFRRALGDLSDAQVFALVDAEAAAREAGEDRLTHLIADIRADLITVYAKKTEVDDEAEIREDADRVLTETAASLADRGAKNFLPVNSGTTSAGNGYYVNMLPLSLPAGKYVFTLKRDNAAATSMSLLDSGGNRIYSLNTGAQTVVEKEFEITADAAAISIYTGFSVTVHEAMICTQSDWALSTAYVPYAPTNAQLYQMIAALQPQSSVQDNHAEEKRFGAPETEVQDA